MKLSVGKVILGVFGLALLWAVMRDPPGNQSSPTVQTAAAKAPATRYDKSKDAQAKREKLLKESNKGGLVAKVECRSGGADVWVSPMFDQVSFDTKSGLAITVHQWCFDGPDAGFVRVRSNLTNKEIAMYSPSNGLSLE